MAAKIRTRLSDSDMLWRNYGEIYQKIRDRNHMICKVYNGIINWFFVYETL